MKFAILAVCVAAVAAKPHVYFFNGPAPVDREGMLIKTPGVPHARATHFAALASASASTSSSSSSSSSQTGYTKNVRGYQGPPAPLDGDGRVIDTAEVAQLKAERLAALNKATAEAQASAGAEVQLEDVPTFIVQADHHRYNGPFAPIGQDGRVINTEEAASLKAEHLATFAEAQAKVAEFVRTSSSSSSAEGNSHDAPVVQLNHLYDGPAAPLGQDGRVVDTDEVAELKAERIATLEKANAEAAASSAESSSSFEGYSYEAPVQKTQPADVYGAPTIPAQSQQIYNGPFATIGQDGRVVDTEEVAKLKAEHLATLAKANAEAAAIEAMEAAIVKSSTDGYHYEAPAVKFEAIPAPTYGAPASQPQLMYNGPLASLGQDGRVIDTDEVASLKAERIATLQKAHAEAAASSAESSSSSEGHYYDAPIQKTQAIPAPIYGAPVQKIQAIPVPVAQAQKIYNGPFATIGHDGRVVDTEEVAKLKAEHLATLAKANAEAAAIEAMEAAIGKTFSDGYYYEAPIQKTEAIPALTYGAPVAQPHQIYNGPAAPLGQDGRVIDTDEVARLKAEHIATLEKANTAAAAAFEVARLKAEHIATLEKANVAAAASEAASSLSSEGYHYEAPIQKTEAIPALTYGAPVAQPHKIYNGPAAPLGQDGRVIDTDEVAKLKAEHIATLEKANAEAAAFEVARLKAEHITTLEKANVAAAASEAASSSSSEGYHYEAPIQKTEAIPALTYGAPVAQPHKIYNGPAAPLGQDGRVIDTDEVAKLKAEHIATLEKANAAAAASETASSSSSEGYHYEAPIQKTEAIPAPIYGAPVQKIQAIPAPFAQAQKIYSGPFATIGHDGRVVDTEEVAKLKAEHIATLEKANAEAAAYEAARLKAEHIATLEKANAAAATSVAASSSSSEGYHYEAPIQKTEVIPELTYGVPVAQPHKIYNGPAAPLGQDGRVIDTDEVAKLKAEHIATLEKANAEAAAYEAARLNAEHIATLEKANAAAAASVAASSSSSEGYHYEAPIQITEAIPALTYGAPVAQPHKIYNGPAAPLGQDGRVIDTDEVAKLKAEHIATLEKANADAAASEVARLNAEHIATLEKTNAAAAFEAASSSSSEGYHYEAPIQITEAIPAPTYGAPVAQPQKIYNGPLAPLGQDGRVIDTDEVARLKAEHIATLEKANAAAAASEAESIATSAEGYTYEAPIQKTEAIPAPTYGAPAATYGAPAAQPQQIYNGPAAPLGQDGRVIDTDEVARLKADHIATLEKANAAAAALEVASSLSSSEQGYSYEAPVTKFNLPATVVPAETYGAPITKIQQTYGGPLAPFSQDGQVIDTQEVAQLKTKHIATLAQAHARAEASAASASSSSSAFSSVKVTHGSPAVQQSEPIINRYSGPLAPLAADGTVIDTDEVARLKADHLATLNKATIEAIAHASAEDTENVYLPPLPAQKPYRGSFRRN